MLTLDKNNTGRIELFVPFNAPDDADKNASRWYVYLCVGDLIHLLAGSLICVLVV